MKRILFTLVWIALIGSAAASPRWNVSPRAAPRAVADATVTVTPQDIAMPYAESVSVCVDGLPDGVVVGVSFPIAFDMNTFMPTYQLQSTPVHGLTCFTFPVGGAEIVLPPGSFSIPVVYMNGGRLVSVPGAYIVSE